MKKIVFGILIFLSFITVFAKVSNKQEENYANIVFFAYFNGQDNTYFENNTDTILSMYNSTEKRSVTSYLEQVSYGKFHIKNYFPQLKNGKIEAYDLGLDIDAYYSKNFDTDILNRVLNHYSSNLGYNLDYNNDGFVDNVTVILLSKDGYTTQSNSTMASHKASYPGEKNYQGKYVGTYNIISTDSVKESEAGVLTHEFMHSIGYSDLYRSQKTGDAIMDDPVGSWDIMSSANYGMSYPLAYLRSRVSNWIDIEEITTSQTLTLHPQTNKDGNQAFILKSPLNEYEYFVVEYRQKGTIGDAKTLDLHIGPSGVIVYRVDTTVEGYSNYHGKTGVFVFRPLISGSLTTIFNASLGNDSYKVNYIGSSNLDKKMSEGALTFSDGSNSGIVIKNVSNLIDGKVTLDVEIPSSSNLDLWKNTNYQDTIGTNASKKGEVIIHNNMPYAVSVLSNKISVSAFNNTWKVKSTYTLSTSLWSDTYKVIEYNNKIHIVYINGSKVEILAFQDNNNTWVKVGTIDKSINYLDVSIIDNKMYIVGIGNADASFKVNSYLYTFDGTSVTAKGSVYMDNGGQPKLISYKNKIYFTYRMSKGKIGVFSFSNGYFSEVSTPFTEEIGRSFDVSLFNDKLYFVEAGGTSNATLYTYDGTTFKSKDIGFKMTSTALTTSQGNLYLLATIDDSLLVYSLDEATTTFNKEGNTVDSSGDSLNSSLVSLNDTIYVATRRTTDNEVVIKSKQTVNRLLSISVTPPNKVSYFLGDSVDKTGLKVKANYTKTSKEVMSYTITNFDTSSVGTKQATVTYEGVSNTFTYEVFEKEGEHLTSITLTPPNKLTYKVGESLDTTGMKVTANYTNHSSEVTGVVTNFSTAKEGTYQAMVSFGELSKTFTYTVTNPLVSISLTPPKKLTYKIGESLDKTGMKVTANYVSGSKTVTNYTISNFQTTKVGKYVATVKYSNLSKTFTYEVINPATSITLTPPKKLTYKIGESLDKTGMKVTVNYVSGSSVVTNYTISNFQTTKVGKYTATVKYSNFSKTFTYEVVNPVTKTFRDLANEKGHKTKDNFVYHFTLNTLLSTIKSKFNETVISARVNIVATGMEFKYKNETYYSVVYGDLNGDGKINSADLLKLRKHLLNQEVLKGAYMEAASVTNDNVINSADLLKIRQHLLGTSPISQ